MWKILEMVMDDQGQWQVVSTRYYDSDLLAKRNWLRLKREHGERFFMLVLEKAAA